MLRNNQSRNNYVIVICSSIVEFDLKGCQSPYHGSMSHTKILHSGSPLQIWHLSQVIVYDIFSFSKLCHRYDIFGLFPISLGNVSYEISDIFEKLWHFDAYSHLSMENVITHQFKRFYHYLPFLEKLKILKFWQIFGKNDTFPKISCYDIFMAFIKKIKSHLCHFVAF